MAFHSDPMNPIETLITAGNTIAAKCPLTNELTGTWIKARDAARKEFDARDAAWCAMHDAFVSADIGHRTPSQRAAIREFRKRFHEDEDGTWTRI